MNRKLILHKFNISEGKSLYSPDRPIPKGRQNNNPGLLTLNSWRISHPTDHLSTHKKGWRKVGKVVSVWWLTFLIKFPPPSHSVMVLDYKTDNNIQGHYTNKHWKSILNNITWLKVQSQEVPKLAIYRCSQGINETQN